MQYFYDAQIRRYLAQLIRMLSGFKVQSADGTEKVVPVMYGDLSRQVANVLRDNSENKIPSAPRISVYISDLKLDTSRLADASYINKINIRERAIDPATNTYTNTQGQNYTVERLMPTPYKLAIKADIWTTNTEQKLQILEQILILFNPSFEIQTTDNYIDWTSLTAIYLDDITFSNRSIPVGTDSDIDVATIGLDTPIWLTPPGKLKRLGVIQTIISNIFTETGELSSEFIYGESNSTVYVSPGNYGVLVLANKMWLVPDGGAVVDETNTSVPVKYTMDVNWFKLLDQYGQFRAGGSRIYLTKIDGTEIVGTGAVDITNEAVMLVSWDPDTFPTNTIVQGRGTIDAIVDPQTYKPTNVLNGIRYLILNDIGINNVDVWDNTVKYNVDQLVTYQGKLYKVIQYAVSKQPTDINFFQDVTNSHYGPTAWKNTDQSNFIAKANDIIAWDGNNWSVVFPASTVSDIVYITNLKTNIQYKWDGEYWTKSFDGEYMAGRWRIAL